MTSEGPFLFFISQRKKVKDQQLQAHTNNPTYVIHSTHIRLILVEHYSIMYNMPAPRNYKKEYKAYHAKPKQKKRRAQRNSARSKMVKAGRARKGDGKDVDHKNRNTADNRSKNLRVVSKSKNRSFSRPKKKAAPKKRK